MTSWKFIQKILTASFSDKSLWYSEITSTGFPFREIGRLKRIAWGWSDKAVTNISKMIMIRQYSRDEWELYLGRL